jgi:hypothetical protein
LVWAIGAGVMALGAVGAIAFTQRGGADPSQDDPATPVIVAPAARPDEADDDVPEEPPRVDEGVPEEPREALDDGDAGGQPTSSPPVAPVAAPPPPADRRPEPPTKQPPKAPPGETDYGF